MSSLYKPTDVTGQEYTRAFQIVIDNPLGKPPAITFHEQRVLNASTGEQRRFPAGQLSLAYDPGMVIPLLDPTTGQPVGRDIPIPEGYAMIYSIYMHAASLRDAAGSEPA